MEESIRVPGPLRPRGFLFLVPLVLVGVVPRLYLASRQRTVWYDQVLYCNEARNILGGKWAFINGNRNNYYTLQESGLSAYNHPFYPLCIAGLTFVTRDLELAGTILSLSSQLVMILVVYRICLRIMGKAWALGAAGTLLLSGHLMTISGTKYCENLYMLCLGLAVEFMIRYREGRRPKLSASLAGSSLGCAYLTKPEALTLVPYFLFLLIVRDRRRTGSGMVVAVLPFIASGFLIISPYLVYLRTQAHSIGMPKKVVYTLIVAERMETLPFDRAYWELNGTATDTLLSARTETESLCNLLLVHGVHIVSRSIKNFHRVLLTLGPTSSRMEVFLYLLLIGAGALATRDAPDRFRTLSALVLFAFLQSIPYSILIFLHRPLITLIPGLVVLGFYSMSQVVDAIARWFDHPTRGLSLISISVAIGWSALPTPALYSGFVHEVRSRTYSREVGRWLEHHTKPGAIISCREPDIPYYAERAHVILPWGGMKQILDYGRFRGVSVVVDIVPRRREGEENGHQLKGTESGPVKEFLFPDCRVLIYDIACRIERNEK